MKKSWTFSTNYVTGVDLSIVDDIEDNKVLKFNVSQIAPMFSSKKTSEKFSTTLSCVILIDVVLCVIPLGINITLPASKSNTSPSMLY